MTERLADITLERYRLGELPALERADVERRGRSDASINERLAALDRSDADISSSLFMSQLAARVIETADIASAPASPRRTMWVTAAAAATLLVAVTMWPARTIETERVKGTAAGLTIYRQTTGGSETLTENAVVREGDVLRVGYRATEAGYGAIVSIDGRGVVSQHLPVEGTSAVPIQAANTVLIDNAFELDDAPDVERFVFVMAPAPFDTESVINAVRGSNGLSERMTLPASWQVATISLRKETRP